MSSGRSAFLRRSVLAAAVGAILGGAASSASAAPDTLREGLFGRPLSSAPRVARYVSEDGQGFVLDRTSSRPLLKFDDSREVFVLQPTAAPRGDVIYKNDQGRAVLRATRLGGLTLFTEARPGGTAVALDGGAASPLRLPALGPQALLERLAQSSARASRAARKLIPFEADADPNSAPLVADAAMVASDALVKLARQDRKALGRVKKVELVQGSRAGATVRAEVVRVTIAPSQGLAGRPSSERIYAVIAEND